MKPKENWCHLDILIPKYHFDISAVYAKAIYLMLCPEKLIMVLI